MTFSLGWESGKSRSVEIEYVDCGKNPYFSMTIRYLEGSIPEIIYNFVSCVAGFALTAGFAQQPHDTRGLLSRIPPNFKRD